MFPRKILGQQTGTKAEVLGGKTAFTIELRSSQRAENISDRKSRWSTFAKERRKDRKEGRERRREREKEGGRGGREVGERKGKDKEESLECYRERLCIKVSRAQPGYH